MESSLGESATISVDELQTIQLNHGKKVTMGESAMSMERLPKEEIPPQDLLFVLAFSDFRKIATFIKSLRIEMVFFFYMFAYIIRSVSSVTMIMEKVCKYHLAFPEDVCDHLIFERYKSQKLQVETMTNNYHLAHTLIHLTPSAILAVFIGPWSDRYGRKTPIIVGLIGILIDGTLATFCAYKMDSRVEYYLACAAFTGFSGGFICVFTIVYSYVSDTTSGDSRTFKYALIEMSMGLAIPLGSLAGGWIYMYTGYVAVFATSVMGHFFALLCVIFLIEETRGIGNRDCWELKVRNFFSLERLKESYRATTKPRPNRGRTQIWFLVFSMSLVFVVLAGGSGISYLYTFHHYSWSNTKYSTVTSIFAVFGLILMLIAVPVCTKVLKLGDPSLGIIGSASNVAKHFCIALSHKEGGFYLANLLGLLSGLSTLAGRSRISKIVSKEDLGKVFAFLSTVESALPIAATAVITQVFNSTVGWYPDPTYLGLAILLVLSLSVYVWLVFLPNVDYDRLQEEEEQQQENVVPSSSEKTSAL